MFAFHWKTVSLLAILSLAHGKEMLVTIPEFLPAQEARELLQQADTTHQDASGQCHESSHRNFQVTELPKKLASSVWSALAKKHHLSWGIRPQPEESIDGQITTLYETTVPHVDCIMSNEGVAGDSVQDKVAVVFLSDSEGAYFTQGHQKVPVQQGTLVMFNGNEEHHTFIPKHAPPVKLLGPFALDATKSFKMGLVGMLQGRRGNNNRYWLKYLRNVFRRSKGGLRNLAAAGGGNKNRYWLKYLRNVFRRSKGGLRNLAAAEVSENEQD